MRRIWTVLGMHSGIASAGLGGFGMTRMLMVAAALVAMLAATGVGAGAEWHVYPGEGTPIQDAVDGAEAGDTIYVHAGTYIENLVVRKSLALVGENRGATVIDGDGSADIIRVCADGCTIRGFTIVGADDCEWAEKTLVTGEVWDIGGGFVLTPLQIDVEGEKVWLVFTRDGREYDSRVMSVGDAHTFTDYKNEDAPVILCYVVGVFKGAESNHVQIKYVLFGDRVSGVDTGVFTEETAELWPIAGIKLGYADSNIVTDNEIRLCNCGIHLQSSDNNILTANTASDNNRGISIRGSSNNNTLYQNNLINNTDYNAYDECTNTWDSGSAGNYYSNYNGTDTDGDGIGDTPYSIPGGSSIDRFPLMHPWTDTPPQIGDLNGDDQVTPADAAIALQLAAGGSSCDPTMLAAADVSGDDRVTSLDALMILQVAASSTTPNENWNAVIETSMGTVTVELYGHQAPNTTANFIELVESGFYDGLIFHRVIDGFVIQGGCPNGDGTGGSGRTIELEIHPDLTHVDGAIAMARSADPASASSQFYVCDGAQHMLDGQYAVFGGVIDGMGVVRAIAEVTTGSNNKPVEDVVIIKISITDRE
ncbi:MAG: hypothetical protein EF813_09390 [Methanosarcinales archaeon]|nr:MAG: hypothetical protein EF813_09390 [Methanosarcinales archaeon]